MMPQRAECQAACWAAMASTLWAAAALLGERSGLPCLGEVLRALPALGIDHELNEVELKVLQAPSVVVVVQFKLRPQYDLAKACRWPQSWACACPKASHATTKANMRSVRAGLTGKPGRSPQPCTEGTWWWRPDSRAKRRPPRRSR